MKYYGNNDILNQIAFLVSGPGPVTLMATLRSSWPSGRVAANISFFCKYQGRLSDFDFHYKSLVQ
jgi:hypothetical protein